MGGRDDRGSNDQKPGKLLDRRSVLQLGAASLAASVAAGVPVRLGAAREQTPGSGQGGGGGQGPGARPPSPPDLSDVVDPSTLVDENWTEPWTWRPSDWPGASLDLQVVGNPHPPRSVTAGNDFTPLFSFNGTNPAPTIRMRGDETLRVTLRNLLRENVGAVPAGAAPDPFEVPTEKLLEAFCTIAKREGLDCPPPPPGPLLFKNFDAMMAYTSAEMVDTSCLAESAAGPHGGHTTNLHTHGLHVEPGMNANGTIGDNTFLKVLPRGDWTKRQQAADPACRQLGPHERVGQADYEHPLGNVQQALMRRQGLGSQPHPPGTFWYHPHKHGSTHDQVASGMAGFLIVEGDVDDAINQALTGEARPDPSVPTGPFEYRERLMLIQRVLVNAIDADHGPRRMQGRFPPPTAVNGEFSPTVMRMRPGAVERWRVLNGSVDGRGFKQFMVLEGQFVFADRQLWRVLPAEDAAGAASGVAAGSAADAGGAGGVDVPARRLVAASRQDVEDATVTIYQLSFDGLTLVEVENGRARYTIKDLSRQSAGTRNPLARAPEADQTAVAAMLRNVEDVYRDGDSIRAAYVRPNQVFLANANRADVFFKAPVDGAGRTYTVFGQEFGLTTDNMQQRLQLGVARNTEGFGAANPPPADVVVGYVHVTGDPVPGGDFDVMGLRASLPPVPPFLQPVEDDELRVPADEAARRGVAPGSFRTRVLGYSGFGPTDFPLVEVPAEFAKAHPELRTRLWDDIDGVPILLPPFARTMAINHRFDLAVNPEPPPPRKFAHNDTEYAKALVDTAEEWVLYNCSAMVWSHTDTERFKQPGQYALHFQAHPIGRAEGQARFAADSEFQITAKGADHPFHIHVNPMWVTRIEVPDEQGRLHNILAEPRWMDTVSIPRDGGRVVFRSRFADYTGKWVNHCHILLHEDFGMMQAVESVARPEDANYNPRTRLASHAMTPDEVSSIYPRPSRELMYRQSMQFVDVSPTCGQVFPGFEL